MCRARLREEEVEEANYCYYNLGLGQISSTTVLAGGRTLLCWEGRNILNWKRRKKQLDFPNVGVPNCWSQILDLRRFPKCWSKILDLRRFPKFYLDLCRFPRILNWRWFPKNFQLVPLCFAGTHVIQVFARDLDGKDGPNGQVTYSIVSQHNKFTIDPNSGWLSTSAVSETDAETPTS